MTTATIVLAVEVADGTFECQLCGESCYEESLEKLLMRARLHLRDGHFVAENIKLAFIKEKD